MIIAALVLAYFAVALACTFAEAKLTGDDTFAHAWVLWPVLLPMMLLAFVFSAVAAIGLRR